MKFVKVFEIKPNGEYGDKMFVNVDNVSTIEHRSEYFRYLVRMTNNTEFEIDGEDVDKIIGGKFDND